jgi:hypothetical protein
MIRSGAFLAATQRLDSEQEIITADGQGRMLFWDCDYPEPVQMLQDPARASMNCCQVSPSGRCVRDPVRPARVAGARGFTSEPVSAAEGHLL